MNVSDGEHILLSKKRIKVSPGEMEYVIIKNAQLNDVEELRLSLEVM